MKETEGVDLRRTKKPGGFGCVVSTLAVNTLLLGLLASSFTQGPFYNHEQVVWYRYASIGFLVAGAVLPAVALVLGARRSQAAIIALIVWMLTTFGAAVVYAGLSGGGV